MIRENICIDFLTATFSYVDKNMKHDYSSKTRLINAMFFSLTNPDIAMLVHVLKFDVINATKEDYAVNGFKVGYTLGENIKLLLGGPSNKYGFPTCELLMSGQACREFEERGGDWNELREYLLGLNGINFTRIDLAFDLFHEDYFTMDELFHKIIDREEFTAKAQTIEPRIRWRRNTHPREYLERAVYIGSLQSETTVNIYDKNLERREKAGQDTWLNTWLRIELRFRGEKAQTVNKQLQLNKNGDFVSTSLGILKSTLEIKANTGATAMRNRKVWHKWNKFLKGIEKIDILNQARLEQTIERKRNWIDNSAGKTLLLMKLAQIVTQDEKAFELELNSYMVDKQEKFTEKDREVLNRHLRMTYGLADLTMDEILEMIQSLEVENR